MSFDVFLQRFHNGDAASADGDAVLAVLAPLVTQRGGAWARIDTADGSADVHGFDEPESGLMVNHASGEDIWDVLFRLAQEAEYAIVPVGCPTCIADPGLLRHLPEGVPQPVTVVSSGADILATLRSA